MYMDAIKLSAKQKEMATLIQAVRIYSEDIGMAFALEKCAGHIILIRKRQN